MTSWTDVINYVRTRYEVLEENDSWLRLRLDLPEGRTQQVSVHHVSDADGVAWIDISSPVGWADQIDLRRLLDLAGSLIVGAAAVVDGLALVKHAVLLADLGVQEEFERAMKSVVAEADGFERELTRTDQF